MGAPAAKRNDRITGVCVGHLVPGPTGALPAPPMPFSAPLTTGLAQHVTIGDDPVAVVGSGGTCNPSHPGLQDAWTAPAAQRGAVVSGSPSVLVEGRPMATLSSNCTMCFSPAVSLVATAAMVLVG